MQLTRREFTGMALGAAAASALSPLAFAQNGAEGNFFKWSPLGDAAWVGMGGGGNALIVVSGGRCALVDCKNFGLGATLRREGEMRGTLAAVINTHHHGDHIGGNHAFTRDLPLYAQSNAKSRIVQGAEGVLGRTRRDGDAGRERLSGSVRDQADTPAGGKHAMTDVADIYRSLDSLTPEQFAPTEVFDDAHEFKVGDLTIQLRHIGPGHTDNDAFVFIPELNLLHTGDLLFNTLHPFIDMTAGASSAGWIRSCEAMYKVCDSGTTVVPGHGEITTRDGLTAQRRYFEILRDAMVKAHQDGKSREDAVALELPEFKDYGFGQIKGRTFGAVYDEIATE